MVDVRENILVRLVAVVATIPTIVEVYRNNVDIPESVLPAVTILDGDEETGDGTDASMRPPNRPTMVQMTPGLIFWDKGELVGSDINMLRRELIKRVTTDTELNQIVKTGRYGNGAIRYLGCQIDCGWLRSLHGALQAQFMFRYALKPDDL